MDNLLAIQNNYVHVKYITYTLHHLVFNRHACRRQTSEDRPRQTINARIKCTPTVDTFTSPSAYRSPRAATDVQCHRRCLETALFRANDLRLPKHGLLFKPHPVGSATVNGQPLSWAATRSRKPVTPYVLRNRGAFQCISKPTNGFTVLSAADSTTLKWSCVHPVPATDFPSGTFPYGKRLIRYRETFYINYKLSMNYRLNRLLIMRIRLFKKCLINIIFTVMNSHSIIKFS